MVVVIDELGSRIGTFDGRFVRSSKSEILYWIEDGEVMCPLEMQVGSTTRSAYSFIGNYNDGTALSDEGAMLFQVERGT